MLKLLLSSVHFSVIWLKLIRADKTSKQLRFRNSLIRQIIKSSQGQENINIHNWSDEVVTNSSPEDALSHQMPKYYIEDKGRKGDDGYSLVNKGLQDNSASLKDSLVVLVTFKC